MMRPPAWLADRNPVSDRVTIRRCSQCGQSILRALVGRTAGLDIRADPTPIGPLTEVVERLAGRLTFCLAIRPHLPTRLLDRDRWHIAGGRCTHIVVAQHHCPGPPARPVQETLL